MTTAVAVNCPEVVPHTDDDDDGVCTAVTEGIGLDDD